MPQTPSPGRALVAPSLTDIADGPDAFADLIGQLDAVASIYFGSLATRGAASAAAGTAKGCPGTLYVATDTGELFLSFDGAWMDLSGASGPPVPLGGAVEYGGAGDPSDTRWLLEDGRPLARVGVFAPLFVVLGTTYGAGDGSTTFNIPDSRGRVTVGTDNMGTAQGAAGRLPNSPNGRGNVGGEERHLLTSGESGVAVHGHGHNLGTDTESADHTHSYSHSSSTAGANLNQGTGGFMGTFAYAGALGQNTGGRSAAHTHAITGGVSNSTAASAASAHNTMQPYVVKNKIIRVR